METQARLDVNGLTRETIGAAMRVHSALGPGLLESAYHFCLLHALRKRGFNVQSEVNMPLEFEGIKLDAGYRVDIIVEDQVLLELKACERLLPIHEAQLLSYLKLSGKSVGLLINFHVLHLRDGIKRMVCGSLPAGPEQNELLVNL